MWGERWVGQSVRFQSDNSAVVALLNSLRDWEQSIIVDSAKTKLRPCFLIAFVREKWSLGHTN